MFGIIIGAAILGIIIASMEGDEFPGWGKMIACVLAAGIPAAVLHVALPPELFILGDLVGAICAGFVIMLVCGMDMKRAFIAAGIYLLIQGIISTAFYFIFKT